MILGTILAFVMGYLLWLLFHKTKRAKSDMDMHVDAMKKFMANLNNMVEKLPEGPPSRPVRPKPPSAPLPLDHSNRSAKMAQIVANLNLDGKQLVRTIVNRDERGNVEEIYEWMGPDGQLHQDRRIFEGSEPFSRTLNDARIAQGQAPTPGSPVFDRVVLDELLAGSHIRKQAQAMLTGGLGVPSWEREARKRGPDPRDPPAIRELGKTGVVEAAPRAKQMLTTDETPQPAGRKLTTDEQPYRKG